MEIQRCKKIKIRKEIIVYFLICLAWGSIAMLLHNYADRTAFLRICVLSSLPIYLYAMYYVVKRTGQWFNPSVIFMMSFYLFQNGKFLLMAFNVQLDNTTWQYATSSLLEAVYFTSICNLTAGLAAMTVFRSSDVLIPPKSWVDRHKNQRIESAAWLGFCLTAIVKIPLELFAFLKYGLLGGYYAVLEFHSKIPSLIGLMCFMFMPFSVLYMVYTQARNRKNFVGAIALFGSCIETLEGYRTSGIAGILVIALLWYLQSENKKELKKYTIRVIILGAACVILAPLIFNFRMQKDLTEGFESLGNVVIGFISELGGSAFPLMTMMDIVPSVHPFQFGTQYICNLITGFFPASLDFLGLLDPVIERTSIYLQWINSHYTWLNYGIGFSLDAEAYINFGWCGFISVFFLCLIVFHNLKFNFRCGENSHTYQSYKTLILLYLWITVPRRSSYEIWNGLLWSCLIMKAYLYIYLNFFFKKSCINKT